MELMNRYVYAVTKQLPEADRAEVEKELQSLMYEMMEEYSTLNEEDALKQVIEKLGDPSTLANKYRGQERYLIGPKYFYQYVFVLKIVLFAILIGITISSILGGIFNHDPVIEVIGNYITNLMFTALQSGAWVTIVFALFSYHNVNLDKEVPWSIKELPEIPNKKALISRGESIFGIIFTTIFFSMLYFAPQLFSVYYKSGSIHETLPIFNLETLNQFKYIIALVIILTILQETLKIIWGKWNGQRAIISGILSVILSGLTIMIFMTESLWNSELVTAMSRYVAFEQVGLSTIIVATIILATIIEIVSSVYKGFMYGNK